MEKKVKNTSPTSSGANASPTSNEPDPYAGQAPDDEEIKASELAMQADQEAMYKLLESDDALATAHEEIKRLNHLNAQLEVRIHGLMNEKNEAENIYFSVNAGSQVAVGQVITPDFLKSLQVATTVNAKGEERVKLCFKGESRRINIQEFLGR